jgi:hypothetical protein
MKPIFIGGCSRSGTTLLGAMIGAHSQIVATPESHFKTEVYTSLKQPADEIDVALKKIVQHHRFKHWSIPLNNRQTIIQQAQGSYPRLILALVEAYRQNKLNKPPTQFWVDHTPSNINYAHLLDSMFPEFKMIHIVRDGRAVAASIIPLDWGPNTAIAAAHFWLESVSFGLAAEQHLGTKRIIRITYEDLVSHPMDTMKSICSFINVPFEQDMTSGTGFTPPTYTASQHRLVGKPPQAIAANRWQHILSPRQIKSFEAITADMLQHFGYDRKYDGKAAYPNVISRFQSDIFEIYRGYLFNKFKHQLRRIRSK